MSFSIGDYFLIAKFRNYNTPGNAYYGRGDLVSGYDRVRGGALPLLPPLSYRTFIPGVTDVYYTLEDAMMEIKREGSISTVMFKPYAIKPYPVDERKTSNLWLLDSYKFFEHYNIPDEFSWFFVESIRINTKNISNSTQNYIRGQGHDDVTTSVLPILFFETSYRLYPRMDGNLATPSNETFTTIIGGKEIVRNKLSVIRNPQSDKWLEDPPRTYSSVNDVFMNTTGFDKWISYFQPIFDLFDDKTIQIIKEDELPRLSYNIRLPLNNVYNPPITFEWSFFKGIAHTNNILYTGYSGFAYSHYRDKLRQRYNFTGIQDNRYTVETFGLGTPNDFQIGVGARMSASPQIKQFMFRLPEYSLSKVVNEADEYQRDNANYAEAVTRNKVIQNIFDAAGLINPFTFHATLLRMISRIPETYFTYIDEQARQEDARKNYSGDDMPFFFDLGNWAYLYLLNSQTTQTLTFPTRSIYYTVDDEKVFHDETTFIEVPINRLFKSVYEFEQYIEENHHGFPLHSNDTYIKVKPFMKLGEYERAYEWWGRLGKEAYRI